MNPANPSLVSDIRLASRDLVRQFGLMNQNVAGTDLSLSAVHAIIEIGRGEGLSATDLCEKLRLEKSTISRLVKTLVGRGEIQEIRCGDDQRVKHLHLTRQGNNTLSAIDRFAEKQVSTALSQLDHHSRLGVLRGLQDYSAALKGAPIERKQAESPDRIVIEPGYTPTLIGRIIVMMQSHMHEHYDFGAAFESRIAADIAEFVGRIGSPRNQTWRAELNGNIVGSISIDGEDLDAGLAHLRWFVVDPSIRGGGVGNALLTKAVDFCQDRGFDEIHLWTVKGLDAARSLYEKHGFRLADEYFGDQWGREVIEHKFVRQCRRQKK